MTELKTLKDLETYSNDVNYPTMCDLISREELKSEAVKWVKDCCKEDATNEILRCDGCNRMVVFFNLTEEDLE